MDRKTTIIAGDLAPVGSYITVACHSNASSCATCWPRSTCWCSARRPGFRHDFDRRGHRGDSGARRRERFHRRRHRRRRRLQRGQSGQVRSRRVSEHDRRRAQCDAADRLRALHPSRRRLGRRPLRGRHRVRLGLVRRARRRVLSEPSGDPAGDDQSGRPSASVDGPSAAIAGSAPTSGTTTRRIPAATCTCWRRSTRRPTRAAPMGSIIRSPGITTSTAAGRGTRAWGTPRRLTPSRCFRQHLLGGIRYAAGQFRPTAGRRSTPIFRRSSSKPDVLNPMELAVAPDGRVFFVERGGAVKIYDPATGLHERWPASSACSPASEHGLLGLRSIPNFATNHWVYLFYSPDGRVRAALSRFTLVGNQLDMASEADPADDSRPTATNTNHSAGSLAFGPGGELYISTGDNTNPFESTATRRSTSARAARLGRAESRRRTPTTCAERSCASSRRPTARTRFPPATCSPPTARGAARRST